MAKRTTLATTSKAKTKKRSRSTKMTKLLLSAVLLAGLVGLGVVLTNVMRHDTAKPAPATPAQKSTTDSEDVAKAKIDPTKPDCGLSDPSNFVKTGRIKQLSRSATTTDDTTDFTLTLPSRGGDLPYKVSANAYVLDSSCSVMNHEDVAVGDMVTTYVKTKPGVTYIVGELRTVFLVIDQTSH